MKTRIFAAALAAFLLLPFFGITALAAPEDTSESVTVTEETSPTPEVPAAEADTPAPVTDYPETPPRVFTPSGTGTVIDYAADSDGKVFYTIMTPDEHVFYLVIDKQRNTDNVYFLNTVTVDDLMALAENPKPAQGGTVTPPAPATTPEAPATPAPEPEPAPEQGGNMGTMIVVAVLVILGGGAGWYFKIYRPKQQGAANMEEMDYTPEDEAHDLDDWGDADPFDEADDNPPWDEDGE